MESNNKLNNNDILNVDLSLIDNAVEIIKKDCFTKLKENNVKLKEIITRLSTEEWISSENQDFVLVMDNYINKLKIVSEFYEQITKDLQKIKIEMEIEMNKKPSIHFE